VWSDTFDRTSPVALHRDAIRRVEVPNVSPRRRANARDLTSAGDIATSGASVPTLRDAIAAGLLSTLRCGLANALLVTDASTFPAPALENSPQQAAGNRRDRA
jgi:hypothetical protein